MKLLQNLIGRVLVDRENNEILVVIRPQKDLKLLFLAAWLAFWVIMPYGTIQRAVRSLGQPGSEHWFELIWSVFWIVGIVAVSWNILWGVGGKELLRVSPSSIDLSSTVLGILFRRRSAPLEDVRNLRYVPASSQGRRSRESCICYEDARGTAKLGGGLSDAEAFAIIDQMLSVHPFPKKDKSLEYLDLSG